MFLFDIIFCLYLRENGVCLFKKHFYGILIRIFLFFLSLYIFRSKTYTREKKNHLSCHIFVFLLHISVKVFPPLYIWLKSPGLLHFKYFTVPPLFLSSFNTFALLVISVFLSRVSVLPPDAVGDGGCVFVK